MSGWPYDHELDGTYGIGYEDDLVEDKLPVPQQARTEEPTNPRHGSRTAVDDILDAVDSSTARKAIPEWECPKCGGNSKVRGPGVGRGAMFRRCTDCHFEWPMYQRAAREEVRPVPIRPSPFAGPYRGEGGPPIDPNQPIQRRITERMRRIVDKDGT